MAQLMAKYYYLYLCTNDEVGILEFPDNNDK